jgi:hypothetical protein
VLDRISAGKRPAVAQAAPGSPRNDIVAIVGGLVLYALFVVWAHAWLTGMPVMP